VDSAQRHPTARHSLQFAVNIWQRFQMPARGRKGAQRILPQRPTYGAPSCFGERLHRLSRMRLVLRFGVWEVLTCETCFQGSLFIVTIGAVHLRPDILTPTAAE
jgi:hypothetical protein